jgi:hypothetical protein
MDRMSLGITQVSGLCIAPAAAQDAAEWDRFVLSHPEARFSQRWGFRAVLENAYGYECVYLLIRAEDRLLGVFPSVVVKHGSKRLLSQPFSEYGGPLLAGVSSGDGDQIAQLLLRMSAEKGCTQVEIRGGTGALGLTESSYCSVQPLHSYAVLSLAPKERLWQKSLTAAARKAIKRATGAGLKTEIRRGAGAVADPFYGLYLVSMKRLGVPPHGSRFFAELAAGFAEDLVAAWVFHEERPVAVLLGLICGQRLQIYITASSPEAWPMRPNDLAHWDLICWAAANGMTIFDFGSARYEGQIQFKEKWGATFHDYQYLWLRPPGQRTSFSLQTVKSSSNLMQAMSRVWRSLVPVAATRFLGPHIRKYLTK